MWVVILQDSTNDIRPIYVGKSKKKADKIAADNEDIDNYRYCYVCFYKGEKNEKIY